MIVLHIQCKISKIFIIILLVIVFRKFLNIFNKFNIDYYIVFKMLKIPFILNLS